MDADEPGTGRVPEEDGRRDRPGLTPGQAHLLPSEGAQDEGAGLQLTLDPSLSEEEAERRPEGRRPPLMDGNDCSELDSDDSPPSTEVRAGGRRPPDEARGEGSGSDPDEPLTYSSKGRTRRPEGRRPPRGG